MNTKYLRLILAILSISGWNAAPATANKNDIDTWNLNVHFVVGVEDYNGDAKTEVDTWIADQVQRAESLYSSKPSLDIHETIERKTRAGGRTLARMEFDTDAEYNKFMDENFDHVAKTKTSGWFTVLVVNDICIGWDKTANGGKERHCIGGRAKFPHWVTPFSRKFGIILGYPDPRNHLLSHELGHVLALKHSFEPYVNVNPSLNCNKDYRPQWDAGHCASCKSGADMEADTCSGSSNLMDYCDSGNRVYLNRCQKDRAAGQRKKYMTGDGKTNYFKIKGALGEPVCKQDQDCPGGYCDTGTVTVGRNQCFSLKADGKGCTRATQCAGGACNVRCYTPNSKNLGQSCNLSGECKSTQCSATGWGVVGGKCVCTEDSHCATGQYCNEGVAGIGTNVCKPKLIDGAVCTKAHMCASGFCKVRCYTPSSKSFGQSCNINEECTQGTCSGAGWGAIPGKCVCTSDSHCATGQYCNEGVAGIGTNVCKPKLADGTVCTQAHMCAGGACNVRCYTPDSKNLGQSCNLSAECKKGKCSGTGWGAIPGKCVCENDSDCASGKYCNTGVAGIGTNVCKSLLANGKACTKAKQCTSDCCKLYKFKLQCRPTNKCN